MKNVRKYRLHVENGYKPYMRPVDGGNDNITDISEEFVKASDFDYLHAIKTGKINCPCGYAGLLDGETCHICGATNGESSLSVTFNNIPCRLDLLIEQLAEVFEDTNSNSNDWIKPISNLLREWKKLKKVSNGN